MPSGTVLLLQNRNEPLGLKPFENQSITSLRRQSTRPVEPAKKMTADGQILLDPQPDDSLNDPLNWPAWRRDCALLSLGFYCMLGGGMTPVLAAGFFEVAETYDVTTERVALTTGLYMMGLGVGSVFAAPTAILFGKRPVYLFSAVLFICSVVWCALAPTFTQLIIARILQGVSVSPVECLPSATIAEIFFLHERAFRVGIYTLLLLGGKNLVPLVSAVIINALSWRWVFWIVALIAGFCLVLLFLFVPETFWDRTPRPKPHKSIIHIRHSFSSARNSKEESRPSTGAKEPMSPRQKRLHEHNVQAGFQSVSLDGARDFKLKLDNIPPLHTPGSADPCHAMADRVAPSGIARPVPLLHNLNSPFYLSLEQNHDYLDHHVLDSAVTKDHAEVPQSEPEKTDLPLDPPAPSEHDDTITLPPKNSYLSTLALFPGRLSHTSYHRALLRPFILFTYPSILWSTLTYSLSIGWLIILSEAMAYIFRRPQPESYGFSPLGVGLIYLSPFLGGILGTVVAGRVSDVIVRALARRNGGVYEPEFRLVMAVPTALATGIGLAGFGWSSQEKDNFWVPTIFFGLISFGCSLGSTTAITFAVDSYRDLAAEALVTLNFSKNVFHGLVFSLFFPEWLASWGGKRVFVALGGLQMVVLLCAVPVYVYGKRGRMWTVRRGALRNF